MRLLHLPLFGVAGSESGNVPGGDLSRAARFLEENKRIVGQSSWTVPSAFGRPRALVVVRRFWVLLWSGSGRHFRAGKPAPTRWSLVGPRATKRASELSKDKLSGAAEYRPRSTVQASQADPQSALAPESRASERESASLSLRLLTPTDRTSRRCRQLLHRRVHGLWITLSLRKVPLPPQARRRVDDPHPISANKVKVVAPPGYTAAAALQSTTKSNQVKPASTRPRPPVDLDELRQQKAWELATAPAKQVPMQAFMMYMSGSGIQIFSIMSVWFLLKQAVAGAMGVQQGEGGRVPLPLFPHMCS